MSLKLPSLGPHERKATARGLIAPAFRSAFRPASRALRFVWLVAGRGEMGVRVCVDIVDCLNLYI